MGINQRIKLAIKWLIGSGVAANQKDIGKMLGYKSESSFSQVLNNKVPLPSDFVDRLCQLSPLLNSAWILDEVGEMASKSKMEEVLDYASVIADEIIDNVCINKDRQPILDIRVCAGNGLGLEGDENKIVEWVSVPGFEGCKGITVYGDSMYDKYKSGDVIFVRPINGRNDFDMGQCYVVITSEDRYIKNVYESNRGDDFVTMVSFNTEVNPDGRRKFPDRDILKEDILFLYKVAGKLRRSQF